jgi:glyoxylase-like metal-dependent hydrolase (beta-lactamase superfamily II)
MILETLVVGALQVNCYVLGCERTRQATVIDPGDNPRAILAALRKHDLSLERIIATHTHFDHLLAARRLQDATKAAFYLHPADRPLLAAMQRTTMAWIGYDPGEPPEVTGGLAAGEVITVGDIALEVRTTPGHSPGGVTLVDHADRRAFTGDALFAGGIGRCDLPGGDLETLLASIRSQILTLPDDYEIYPGHGPASTVGEEKWGNPFLAEGVLESGNHGIVRLDPRSEGRDHRSCADWLSRRSLWYHCG